MASAMQNCGSAEHSAGSPQHVTHAAENGAAQRVPAGAVLQAAPSAAAQACSSLLPGAAEGPPAAASIAQADGAADEVHAQAPPLGQASQGSAVTAMSAGALTHAAAGAQPAPAQTGQLWGQAQPGGGPATQGQAQEDSAAGAGSPAPSAAPDAVDLEPREAARAAGLGATPMELDAAEPGQAATATLADAHGAQLGSPRKGKQRKRPYLCAPPGCARATAAAAELGRDQAPERQCSC